MKGKKIGDENLEKASGGYEFHDISPFRQMRTTFTDEEADKLNKKFGLAGRHKFEGGIQYCRDDIRDLAGISSYSAADLKGKLADLGLYQEGPTHVDR